MTGSTMQGRCWLTAKGYRALGHHVPDDVADHEVIIPATAPPPVGPNVKRPRWWRRSR
jgi:hypothetical protein